MDDNLKAYKLVYEDTNAAYWSFNIEPAGLFAEPDVRLVRHELVEKAFAYTFIRTVDFCLVLRFL